MTNIVKEKLRVGKTSYMAETIPVDIIYDEIFDAADFPIEVIADRFQVLDVDGTYLVIHESLYDDKPSQQKFKAFVNLNDAHSYLEMFGVDIDGRLQSYGVYE